MYISLLRFCYRVCYQYKWMLGVGVSGGGVFLFILQMGEIWLEGVGCKWFFGCPKMGNQVRVCDGMYKGVGVLTM